MTSSCLLPDFSLEQAAQFARQTFALDGSLEPLDGERDLNFLITTAEQKFVLKIANADESPAMLECQHEVFQRLADAQVFPRVATARPSVHGRLIETLSGSQGEHACRVLPFIDGNLLADVDPLDPALLEDLGRRLARLDQALESFTHPALERPLLWDLRDALSILAAYKPLLADDRKRVLVEHFETGYRARVGPRREELRRAVIHNDANRGNVVVDPTGERVISIIDFGDMIDTWLVAEPAIAACYTMLGQPAPLQNAGHLLRGYHAELPLDDIELDLFFDLACMRLCMSVCICAHQRRLAPDNAYLSVDEEDAWELLAQLRELNYTEARDSLRAACC